MSTHESRTHRFFSALATLALLACESSPAEQPPPEAPPSTTICVDGQLTDGRAACDLPECAPLDLCEDGNPCTLDACDPASGCSHAPQLDATPAECDDGDPCTTDGCGALGCVHEPAADPAGCDDGDPCTTESCGPKGCEYAPVEGCCSESAPCFDGDPCTRDVCDPASHTCTEEPIAGCCVDDGDCGEGFVCVGQVCTSEDAPELPLQAAFFTQLDLADPDVCCVDLNGDGVIDSRLTLLVALISDLVVGVKAQTIIDQDLASGVVSLAVAFPEGVDLGATGSLALSALRVTGPPDALAVDGDPAGLVVQQDGTSVTDGSGGFWAGWTLLPFTNPVPGREGAKMHVMDVEATLTPPPEGVAGLGPGLEGWMAGAVPLSELAADINAHVEQDCACLDLDGPLLTVKAITSLVCTPKPASSTCGSAEETESCELLADFCGLGAGFMKADVDTDADGIADALSVAFQFTATPASIAE